MENLVAIVLNSTTVTFDMCKICLDIIPLYPSSRMKLPLTAHGGMHGHSDIGSFTISKHYNNFAHQTWGNIEIQTSQKGNEYIFEIKPKK